MLFNSIEFLIFFPIVAILYFIVPFRARLILLLVASYYFYMSWKPEYILLIVASTAIDYFAAKKMGGESQQSVRKKYLILSLVSNLGLLFFFKYFNFFNDSAQTFLSIFNIDYQPIRFNVLLPVGISFYTFQTLSYTIDVYRGLQKPQSSLAKFALYVSFFPQLVAGPIERSIRLLPQFDLKHQFDYVRITDGLKLMAWGFFKKLVIADRLAVLVNSVYNNQAEYSGVPLILATYFFAFQIYCDFSGYSDIAIGAAKVMGFNLMENFRQPYFAQSINDFWHRWHISLSTWFRDYVYIPLGGNRVVRWRWYFNLIIVFLVSGLWHGANWTFVIWGALHGFYTIATIPFTKLSEKYLSRFSGKTSALIQLAKIFITFHLVLFSWIFFRANSISDALSIVGKMFMNLELKTGYGLNFGGTYEILITSFALITLILVDFLRERGVKLQSFSKFPIYIRWFAYYALVFGILIFGKFGVTEFIYFQF